MYTNYHTHTSRCGHAVGSDEQYVLAAIEAGLQELGFSDHMPYPDAYNPLDRMPFEQVDDYIASINHLKEKYKDQIKIYVGFEMDFFEERMDFYKMMAQKVDYLINGQHYKILDQYGYDYYTSDEDVLVYTQQVCAAMRSGLVKFLAHPDYFMLGRNAWSEACALAAHQIAACAQECNIPLEINLKGTKYGKKYYNGHEVYAYPFMPFWEIVAKYDVKALISLDAHAPLYLFEGQRFEEFKADFQKFGIKILKSLEI